MVCHPPWTNPIAIKLSMLLFASQTSKPRPNDASIMFVFVVGGVTLAEARDVRKIVDDHNALSGQNLQVDPPCFGRT